MINSRISCREEWLRRYASELEPALPTTALSPHSAHGETYLNDREELWWSKGGVLVGDSPARLGFLRDFIEAAPRQLLEPLAGDWDLPWGGDGDDYRIAYFGFNRPRFRNIHAPAGRRYTVDVIDTWDMTITRLDGEFAGTFSVELPARQYMALRLMAVGSGLS